MIEMNLMTPSPVFSRRNVTPTLARFILPFVAIATLLLNGCQKTAQGPHEMPPRPVTAAKVAKQNVPLYLEEIGYCVAVESVTISAQVTGKVTEIHFLDGTNLKKGDKLFTIDPRPYEADLARAEAAAKKDQATLELNKSQMNRSKDLVPGNYVSSQDWDTIKTSVATSEAQVKSDEADVATAQINLEYCHITSPLDGLASVHLVDVGNVVSASPGTALLSIQRMDPMYIDFNVAEPDLPRVRDYLGSGKLSIEIYRENDPAQVRTGDLFLVDNAIQQGTGTVKLRAIAKNGDRYFWPGQFVRVRIILKELDDALMVPYSAVQISQQGPYLFVIDAENKAQMRPVVAGQRQGELVVITKGVTEGETVVATGQLGIGPGSKVMVLPPAGAAQPDGAPPSGGKPDDAKSDGSKSASAGSSEQ